MDPILFVLVLAAAVFISLLLTVYIFFFVGNYKFGENGGFKEDLKRMINEIYIPTPRTDENNSLSVDPVRTDSTPDGHLVNEYKDAFNVYESPYEAISLNDQEQDKNLCHAAFLDLDSNVVGHLDNEGNPLFIDIEGKSIDNRRSLSLRSNLPQRATFYKDDQVVKAVILNYSKPSGRETSNNYWTKSHVISTFCTPIKENAWDVNRNKIYKDHELDQIKRDDFVTVNGSNSNPPSKNSLHDAIKAQAEFNLSRTFYNDMPYSTGLLTECQKQKLLKKEEQRLHKERLSALQRELKEALSQAENGINKSDSATSCKAVASPNSDAKAHEPITLNIIKQECVKLTEFCAKELSIKEDISFNRSNTPKSNASESTHANSPASKSPALESTPSHMGKERYYAAKASHQTSKDKRMTHKGVNAANVLTDEDKPNSLELKILLIMPISGAIAALVYLVYALMYLTHAMSFNILFTMAIACWFLYICLKFAGALIVSLIHQNKGDSEHWF